jgi:hypothetical protein
MKKQQIKKELKNNVWTIYNKDKGETKCPCCDIYKIYYNNFDCGHIQAEANGGPTILSNLIPICHKCNCSMGTMNYFEFKKILDGRCVIPENIPEMVRVKVWHKYYKNNKNGKCVCCKKIEIDMNNFSLKKKEFRKTECFINDLVPLCTYCSNLLRNNDFDDIKDKLNFCCCVVS